jgi:molecular chaperone DnaJ
MNTTDNIKSLFNSANPMTTENSYEPSGVCIGDTVLDNTPSGFALFQAIGGHYTSPAQAIEELVDNAISSIKANGGSGKVIKDKCSSCGGSGRVRMRRTLELDVPAGVDDNIVLSKRGQGEPGANGGPNGDLLIQITVKPHKLFRREGTNLRLEVPISFTQAALGAEIDVPTLDGSVKYTIPEGTQTDTEFRIRGKGIQQLGSNNKGDLIFKVRVETPRRLTEKQRELLRQFDGDDNGKQYDQRKTFIDKVKELFDK